MIPDWDSGDGIFSVLDEYTVAPPWKTYVNAVGLDIAYHGQRSGEKFVTSMCYNWLDDDGEITSAGLGKIASAIMARYGQKWEHLWALYTAQYNPLQTYQVTESGSDSRTNSVTGSRTRTPNLTTRDVLDQDDTDSHTSSETTTYGKRTSTKDQATSLDQAYRYPYNPGSGTISGETGLGQYGEAENPRYDEHAFAVTDTGGLPTDATKRSGVNEGTSSDSGSDGHTGSVSGTNSRDATNTRTETGTEGISSTESGTDSGSYSRSKAGNMYRSPAELMDFDREFWMIDFFSIVFADIDEMLTLGIYSERPINYTII